VLFVVLFSSVVLAVDRTVFGDVLMHMIVKIG
jgi:hypothetical protein